ncbi:Cys-tRNA(Pro) deacylase [Enterococcus sp. AZ072]|uniref:Cys-tRNA(Pro) deacylase n=1 Tax=unclassified Enterococcus TaxID=2608891 RepID=UPI003D2A99CE
MAKKKITKTNAIRLVEKKKLEYVEHEYQWSEDDLGAGHVSEQVEIEPERIFKTLVAVGNKTGPVVAVIPSNHELNLKKIAKVSGNKKVEMLHLKELEATTGYVRGGCSPIGMKKLFPTFLDESAKDFAKIAVSAGRRGLQMELSPSSILLLTKGQFASLVNS